jgi:DNA-binding transcriptional MerR regulator
VSSRSYLSIGDVLTLLRQEFPDVTISKIRFLESQGLVNPERTPSGYRKFYEHDVERLRWVLRQQREHFLPLKVIKDRLDEDAGGSAPVPVSADGAAGVPETPTVHGPASAAGVVEAPPTAEVPVDAAVLVGTGTTPVKATPQSTSGRPGIEKAARHTVPARATVGAPAASSRLQRDCPGSHGRTGRARPPRQFGHPVGFVVGSYRRGSVWQRHGQPARCQRFNRPRTTG